MADGTSCQRSLLGLIGIYLEVSRIRLYPFTTFQFHVKVFPVFLIEKDMPWLKATIYAEAKA